MSLLNEDHTGPYHTLSVRNLYEKVMSRFDSLPPSMREHVTLLRNLEVIKWILEDTEFLTPENPIVGYKKKTVREEDGQYKNGKNRWIYSI